MNRRTFLSLDIGQKRIGVATADTQVKIAIPYDTIEMNETQFREDVIELVTSTGASIVVIGYPRNQSGEPTQQTAYVEKMAEKLIDIDAEVVFQDESLTSVMAHERLGTRQYDKGSIDAEAATIILQDYMEQRL